MIIRSFNILHKCGYILITVFLLINVSCSSQQQVDDELDASEQGIQQGEQGANAQEADAQDNSNYGMDDAAEGNGQENFAAQSDEDNYNVANSEDSENINSDGDESLADENTPQESDVENASLGNNSYANEGNSNELANDAGAFSNDEEAEDPLAESPVQENAQYAQGTEDVEPEAEYVATEETMDGGTEAGAAQQPASEFAPIAGGRVRYVPEGGAQVFDSPNGNPTVLLEKGQHPLTWDDESGSGWLRLTPSMYLPTGSLSEQGIGK